MIDIKLIRENPELVKENIRKKLFHGKQFLYKKGGTATVLVPLSGRFLFGGENDRH